MTYPQFANLAAVNAELAEIAEVRYALRHIEQQSGVRPSDEAQQDLDARTRELLTVRRELEEDPRPVVVVACIHCGRSHVGVDACQP
jgi:hypothetical protein